MNYEDLRRIQRLEKGAALAPIEPDFYGKLAEMVKYHKTRAQENAEDSKMLENILKISKDIFERREQKTVQKALNYARTGKLDKEPFTPEEKEFFDSLAADFTSARDDFESALSGNAKKEAKRIQRIDDIPALFETEDLNCVLVRITKKVPKFVSDGLKEHGPYEENEIVKLPKKEAEILSAKNFAEKI